MFGKADLITEILRKELEMFLNVPTLQKASCQEDPDGFRTIRRAQFLSWSEGTLEKYNDCLQAAKDQGRNLMTEKYARMEGLIPGHDQNPLIEKIVLVQYEWQKQMIERYPHLMNRARPLSSSEDRSYQVSFETYLRCELATYSDETLEALYGDIEERLWQGINMTEEVYEHMVNGLGYESLYDAEKSVMESRNSHWGE